MGPHEGTICLPYCSPTPASSSASLTPSRGENTGDRGSSAAGAHSRGWGCLTNVSEVAVTQQLHSTDKHSVMPGLRDARRAGKTSLLGVSVRCLRRDQHWNGQAEYRSQPSPVKMDIVHSSEGLNGVKRQRDVHLLPSDTSASGPPALQNVHSETSGLHNHLSQSPR